MQVDILIPFCNYMHSLHNLTLCLESLRWQTRRPDSIYLADDSLPQERTVVQALCREYGVQYLPFPFVNYAPAFSRKMNGMFAQSQGQIIVLLCSNWVLSIDWLQLMLNWLVELGPGNLVTGNSDRPGHFQGAREPVAIGDLPLWDSGYLEALFRQDWLPWDEEFDPAPDDQSATKGAWHATTEWHARLQRKGMRCWTRNDVTAHHLERQESPEWVRQVWLSLPLLRSKGVQ